MPAFQAEGTLEQTIADIPAGAADELILVDDASVDNTAELARGLGIEVHVHPENRGYGANQKTCYTTALRTGADVVVLLHPDYQYDPKAVPLLVAPITGGYADMTFGSRFAGLGDPRAGGMPLYRFVGNRITTFLQNMAMGTRFTEMHSGLRAYTRECLLSQPFLSYTDDFAFDSQFLVDAVTSGVRVVEVPIGTRYSKESSSISVLRSLKYVSQSLLYALRRSNERGRRPGRRSAYERRATKRADASRDRLSHAVTVASGFLTESRVLIALTDREIVHPDWDVRSYVEAGTAPLGEADGGTLLVDADTGLDIRGLTRSLFGFSDLSLIVVSSAERWPQELDPKVFRPVLRDERNGNLVVYRRISPQVFTRL